MAGYGSTNDFNQASFMLFQNYTKCTNLDSDNQTSLQQHSEMILCGQGLSGDVSEDIARTCNGDSGGPLMFKTVEFISDKTITRWNLGKLSKYRLVIIITNFSSKTRIRGGSARLRL